MQTSNAVLTRRDDLTARLREAAPSLTPLASGPTPPRGGPMSSRSAMPGPAPARSTVLQSGGFAAFDRFSKSVTAGQPALRPQALEPANDPFQNLAGLELVRAIRKASLAEKRKLTYPEVRHLIFTVIDNIDGKVTCAYTGRVRQGHDVPQPNDMNIEHAWPQSRGAKGEAKTDMHHLLAVDSQANTERGNLPFGMVTTPTWQKGGSILGTDKDGDTVFMPRPQVRGNIARAIFYFATVYGFEIDKKEEAVLRTWDKADPVDVAERKRTNDIAREQGEPNFFVLYPNLIDRIPTFPRREAEA